MDLQFPSRYDLPPFRVKYTIGNTITNRYHNTKDGLIAYLWHLYREDRFLKRIIVYTVYDAIDMEIPPEVLDHSVYQYKLWRESLYKGRYRIYGGYKGRRYNVLRNMRHYSNLVAALKDPEFREYGIRLRPTLVPTPWDDVPRSEWDAKNWKHYRKTQYKTKELPITPSDGRIGDEQERSGGLRAQENPGESARA